MIPSIRLKSHQLSYSCISNPKDLVAWMGAIQAQNYNMAKWAIGLRCGSCLQEVDDALRKGEIIRTHILRPTWHFVTAEDLHWMLRLSSDHLGATIKSYSRQCGMTEELYLHGMQSLERLLRDGNHLTKQELSSGIIAINPAMDPHKTTCLLMYAESQGLICSGIDRGNKSTYALLEERVARPPELSLEESLAQLASRYFKSHSPASLKDFVWWSGLSVSKAKRAINLIQKDLITERFATFELYLHQLHAEVQNVDQDLHVMPSYDEYLISYKDRTFVLDLEDHRHAFTNNGIFYPVLLHRGKVVGNWTQQIKKGKRVIETSFFKSEYHPGEKLIQEATNRYLNFFQMD